MRIFRFISQFFKKPRVTGAILPSSKRLAKKMMKGIDFHHAKYIVEYGPGTGVFTDEIIERRDKDTIVMLIENNDDFYKIISERYKHEKNLIIVNGSAENVDMYLEEHHISHIDFVVSGLPFASLPKEVSNTILTKTKKHLKDDGKFITFQYTQFKREFINQYFSSIEVEKELRNVPPAYVFSCSK